MDECANDRYATARCRPLIKADNRVVAGGEDGYFNGTTGLPVGLHIKIRLRVLMVTALSKNDRKIKTYPITVYLLLLITLNTRINKISLALKA